MYFSKIPSLYNILTFFKKSLTQEQFLNFWNLPNSYARLISRSSWSLELISRFKNKKPCNIYVPSYFCNYALKQLRKNNTLSFYPVKNDFTLDLEFLKKNSKNIDILILVNYFGKTFINNEIYQFCKINKIWLVEDNTHIFLPIKKEFNGDFQLYSPYKFLPIPLGAVLTLNSSGPNNLHIDLLKDEISWKENLKEINKDFNNLTRSNLIFSIIWVLKKIIQNIFDIPKSYESFNHEVKYKKIHSVQLDIFSKRILLSMPRSSFLPNNNKKVSIQIWNKFLQQKNINNNFDNDSEYTRYLIKNDEILTDKIYTDFVKKNLPISTWPDLPREIYIKKDFYSETIKLRNSLIFLPTFSTDNLKYINTEKNFNNSLKLKNLIRFDFNKKSKDEWNNFLGNCDNSNLIQSWEHGEAKIKNSKITKVIRFFIYHENELVGACQMFRINFLNLIKFYFINRGPVFLKNINDLIKKKTIERISLIGNIKMGNILMFAPDITIDSKLFLFNNNKYFFFNSKNSWASFQLDLRLGIDNLKKSMSETWKNIINNFEKNCSDIVFQNENTIENFEWIIKSYSIFKKQNKFKGITAQYLEFLFKQNVLSINVLKKNSKICAANIYYIQKNVATNLIEFSNPYAKKRNLNYFLLYNTLLSLMSKNILKVDQGGVSLFNLEGIYNFKKSLGGKFYQLIGNKIFI